MYLRRGKMKNELKNYYKSISKNLKYSFYLKRTIIKQLKRSINVFIETSDKNITITDIYDRFSKPDEIIQSLDDNYLNSLKKKSKILIIITSGSIIVIIILVMLMVFLFEHLGEVIIIE